MIFEEKIKDLNISIIGNNGRLFLLNDIPKPCLAEDRNFSLEIIKLGFKSTNFFRPGHLQGKSHTEKWATLLADFFSKILDIFLVGSLSKFKSIEGDIVAKAMVFETKKSKPGVNYFYFNEMIQSLINATPSE